VESGYSGGTVPNPTYKQVCGGDTGHAEVIQVTFDPKVIALKQILRVFFTTHDPTTLNRQGGDSGTQYRSCVIYRDAAQKTAAEQVIQEITAEKIWGGKIVTTLEPFQKFYKAEDYHQEYFARNGDQPYLAGGHRAQGGQVPKHYLEMLKK
jgi:peptide-methionine (S)-S-oxide reductase